MAKSKFKTKYIVIPLLVLSLVGGAFTASTFNTASSDSVKVAAASELDQSMWGGYYFSEGDFIGTLKKGSVQNVKYDGELKIEDVLVKKGDTVKKGDKLFTYDLNSLKFALADAENALTTVENKLKVANNELTVLKKLQPSENVTTITTTTVNVPDVETPDVPEADTDITDTDLNTDIPEKFTYDKKITEKSEYSEGKGTSEEPYVYYVGEDTVVTKEFLKSLRPEEKDSLYAVFYVCDETGTPLYARLVDGNKIDVEKAEDWNVSDGVVSDNNGGFSFDGGSANFASFVVQSQSPQQVPGDIPDTDLSGFDGEFDFEGLGGMGESFEIPDSIQPAEQPDVNTDTDISDEITEKDNYKFSTNELKDMISQKENDIEKLNLEKRQSEIDVKKAKKTLETGAEVSTLDGIVTFVAKDIQHLSESGAYITVTSSNGMSVASSIGEFSLSKIEVGTKMTITNYDDGSTYSGEVTSISDVPSQTDRNGNENTTESYYEFVVTIDEEFELPEDGSVNMTIDTGNEEGKLMLYDAFVGTENGKYYVMAANDDNVIEKRYVTVSKKVYELFVIKGGLSSDDRIALAYGKVQEGMKAVDADGDTLLWGSGLF